MKKVFSFFVCWHIFTCLAQVPDSASRIAASYFREAAAASKDQHVWNKKLYGPMLFVDPVTRLTYSNTADSAGVLQPDGDIYSGTLPKEVIIANTSIKWQGRLWSVILWPLPDDHDERLNLLFHESFHRIQEDLGLPERSPTADHLSGINGRICYLLELQALKAAMQKPVDQRNTDLTNALIFREKRHELFPATFENERILELSEGVAEYTGVILGRNPDSILPHLYQQMDSAGERKSLIRSFEYTTGPVYGYLLYERSPGWTLQIDSNSDLPHLIARYYHIDYPRRPIGNKAYAAIEQQYNGDAIVRSEKIKEEKRQQVFSQYTDLFTRQPVLTITLVKMGIGFNPSSLIDLGKYGTVYPTAEVKDSWGQLNVSAPGMLMKDWKVITLPASEDIHVDKGVITGNGWKLLLNQDWVMLKVDPTHYKLAYKN